MSGVIINAEILDWIEHGCALRRDLLDKARWLILHKRMTPADEKALEREIEHRRRALLTLRGFTLRLTAVDLAWRDYMVAHGRLQVDRQRGLLDQAEFLGRCHMLIQERETRLKGLDDGRNRDRYRG